MSQFWLKQGFPQWVGWENVTGFRSTISILKATHPFFNIVNKFSTYALSLLRRLMFTLNVTYNFSKNQNKADITDI